MTNHRTIFLAALATIIWGCVFGLQRPPPRYSQQYMPQTSFSCRNKIVGSYYADPETDCQLFHVCVSVAGSIQDYRFLCPNDTAFDQESQTCADWYDVDCEAATLYYASDNFDLYRLGSGLESLHYDSIRSDFEPQDHLQRSESNDPIRSPLNAYNSNSYKEAETSKKSNQFAARNQKQISPDFEKEKEKLPEPEKKNLRKVHRKPAVQGFSSAYTTTLAPVQPTQAPRFVYSTASPRASSPAVTYTSKTSSSPSTLRPTTKYAVTTFRASADSQDSYSSNYQTTTARSSSGFHNHFNGFNRFETTAKPANPISTNYPEPQTYPGAQYSQAPSSTTKQPPTNYQQHNQAHTNNNNHYNNNYNYNNVQRTNNTTAYPTTTPASNNYDNNYNNNNYNNNNNHNNNNNYNNNYNNNNNNYNGNYESRQTSKKADYNQNTYTANTYAPTTYSPVTKKFNNNNNRQYFDKSTTLTTKSAQYSETDSTKAAKKITQYKNYQNYETTTRSYDFGRSSVGLGFSPSSVNHLAENVRPTTPTPRRAAAPTTYNPNSFNANTHATQSQTPQQKSSYYQNQPTKQHSTTPRYFEESTTRKAAKKNDYDYAYYDNGPLEYDNLELEHVTSNKESVKIT